MSDKKDVVDISNKSFKDELIALSTICNKLNNIYKKMKSEEAVVSSEDEKEKVNDKGLKIK